MQRALSTEVLVGKTVKHSAEDQALEIKSYTTWLNHHLSKRSLKVDSLATDFSDGVLLSQLLEVLTSKPIPKIYKNPKNRAFKIENCNICLNFIRDFMSIKLVGVSAAGLFTDFELMQDIVDGRLSHVLGMIWAIIRKFYFGGGNAVDLSKERLLAFFLSITLEYSNVNIINFDTSFHDGLAFCAIIHKYDPNLIDFNSLTAEDSLGNLSLAFSIAANSLGIPPLMQPEDVKVSDERIITTYLANFFQLFQKREEEKSNPKRRAIMFSLAQAIETHPKTIDAASIEKKIAELKLAKASSMSSYSLEKLTSQENVNNKNKEKLLSSSSKESVESKSLEGSSSQEKKVLEQEKPVEPVVKSTTNEKKEEKNEQIVKVEEVNIIENKQPNPETILEKKEEHIEQPKLESKNEVKEEQAQTPKEEKKEVKPQEEPRIEEPKETIKVVEEPKEENQNIKEEIKVVEAPKEEPKEEVKEEVSQEIVESPPTKEDTPTSSPESVQETKGDSQVERKEVKENFNAGDKNALQSDSSREGNQATSTSEYKWENKSPSPPMKEGLFRLGSQIKVLKTQLSQLEKEMVDEKPIERDISKELKRIEVAREVHKTEITYVNGLKAIVEVFLKPLRAMNPPIISKSEIKNIFSEIEVIVNYNVMLLKELQTRMENWTKDQIIGDIFLKITDFLKVYTQYVNNYNRAIQTMHNCEKNERFASFLLQSKEDPRCNNLHLSQLLIFPIQRIPRYVLLLEVLVDSTYYDHVDYEKLKQSLAKMKEVAEYVNEKKREADNINEVLTIQDKMEGEFENLALPHRRYIREGFLQAEIIGVKKKQYYFFLFNDILVGAKRKGKLFQTTVSTYKYFKTIQLDYRMKVNTQLKAKNAFSLTLDDPSAVYSFTAPNPQEKEEWVTCITEALRKLGSILISKLIYDPVEKIKEETRARRESLVGTH